jgi:hypothetical protein
VSVPSGGKYVHSSLACPQHVQPRCLPAAAAACKDRDMQGRSQPDPRFTPRNMIFYGPTDLLTLARVYSRVVRSHSRTSASGCTCCGAIRMRGHFFLPGASCQRRVACDDAPGHLPSHACPPESGPVPRPTVPCTKVCFLPVFNF